MSLISKIVSKFSGLSQERFKIFRAFARGDRARGRRKDDNTRYARNSAPCRGGGRCVTEK